VEMVQQVDSYGPIGILLHWDPYVGAHVVGESCSPHRTTLSDKRGWGWYHKHTPPHPLCTATRNPQPPNNHNNKQTKLQLAIRSGLRTEESLPAGT
jgi:hypothetical protein